jgi:hypothetical protein
MTYPSKRKLPKKLTKAKEFAHWEASQTNLHLKLENAKLKGENAVLKEELRFYKQIVMDRRRMAKPTVAPAMDRQSVIITLAVF